jgi:ribosomal RNA-processing protein 36
MDHEDSSDEEEAELIKNELKEVSLGELQQLRQQVGVKKFNAAFKSNGSSCYTKRADSNYVAECSSKCPDEMSSKRPVKPFRQVIPTPSLDKRVKCDPRFDERCGHLNKDLFMKSYAFLDDIQDREKHQLAKEMKKTKSSIKREKLNKLLQRMVSEWRS